MSTAHAAPAESGHAHDPHAHAHDFDGEPARTLSEGEPRTPGWVPILGLSLFLVASIFFLVTGDAPGEGAVAKAATPAPPSQTAQPANAAPANAAPAGGDPSVPSLTREQIQILQRTLDEAKVPSEGTPSLTREQIQILQKKLDDARAKLGGEAPAAGNGPGR